MPYQWFFLQQDRELGPITAKDLKQLADSKTVIPSTPVRRASPEGSTPWMRAGAIQSLFQGNVIDQLGPIICDDCGKTLPNLSCQKCNSSPSPLSGIEDLLEFSTSTHSEPQPVKTQPQPVPNGPALKSHRKQPDLRRDIDVLQISARILMALALVLVGIFVILFANDVIATGRIDVILGALAFMLLTPLVAFLGYKITMTFAKALRDLLD